MLRKILKSLDNPKFIDKVIPFLVVILIALMFLFTFSCVKTSQSAFRYNIKVREKAGEIYHIFESSESNLGVFADTIEQSYNAKNINNIAYNKTYLKNNQEYLKAVIAGIPEAQSAWFTVNSNPASSISYIKKYNKILASQKGIMNIHNFTKSKLENKNHYASTKDKVIIFKPIYKSGKLVGIVGVDISLKSIIFNLNNMQKDFLGSDIFLLNEHNSPIVKCFAKPRKENEKNVKVIKNYIEKASNRDDVIVYQERLGQSTALVFKMKNGFKMIMSCPNNVIYKGNTRLFEALYLFLAVLFLFLTIFLYNKKKIIILNKQLETGLFTQKIILNSSPMGIAIKNTQGVYVDCNEKYAQILNVFYEDIIGKDDHALFDKKTADVALNSDNSAKAKNEATLEEEWLVDKSGKKLLLEKYRIPLFNSDNEIMGILITVSDITKRKEEQDSLKNAKDAAEKATEMKSNFLANMSHEIRTPLNGVLGFLQLLENTDLSNIQKEFVNNAQKSSELLLNIINEILDISKIEAGRMTIDSTSFNIRSAVEDVTTIAISNDKSAGLNINALIRSDVPHRVLGDPGRVKQILTNLMGNAIKFTKKGEVIIYVNKVSETDTEVTVSFKVKDTGIGIPQEKLDYIFGAFVQADASTTRNFGGTGLGLAISRKLTNLMGGNIDVVSEVNVGSTFTLTLPFKKDLNSSLTTDNLSKNLNGKTIMVIDDKPTDIKIISHYVNDANGIVIEANMVEQALEILKLKKDKISVILIDSKLQTGIDFDLQEEVKKAYGEEVPMILYTSLSKRGDALLSKQKGFTGYLTKPIKKHELLDGIAIAINGVRNDMENKFISKHLIKETKFDSKAKILVVEDSELNIKLILNIFKNANLSCDVAVNGREAIESFKSGRYDIILMDCELPEIDGYEATQAIRELESKSEHIPIIAMTANVLNEDKQKCYDAGMDDYLCKPINIKEFYDKLAKYINVESANGSEEESFSEEDSIVIIKTIMQDLEFSLEEANEMLSKYLEIMPKKIHELQQELNNENFFDMSQIVHKIKGSSANLRINKMVQICEELNSGIEHINKEQCQQNIEKMNKYLDILVLPSSFDDKL